MNNSNFSLLLRPKIPQYWFKHLYTHFTAWESSPHKLNYCPLCKKASSSPVPMTDLHLASGISDITCSEYAVMLSYFHPLLLRFFYWTKSVLSVILTASVNPQSRYVAPIILKMIISKAGDYNLQMPGRAEETKGQFKFPLKQKPTRPDDIFGLWVISCFFPKWYQFTRKWADAFYQVISNDDAPGTLRSYLHFTF